MIPRALFTACLRRRAFATVSTPPTATSAVGSPELELPDEITPENDGPVQGSLWVKLHGLPRAVAPADLYRHAAALRLRGLQNVHLDYKNFMPTGRAWLRFDDPEQAEHAVKTMQNSRLAAHPLRAHLTTEENIVRAGQPYRVRGEKGRAEAVERGILTGNGPDARVKERGTCVYLWGLPGTTVSYDLRQIFESYGLRVTAEAEHPVRQIYRHVSS
ncbi:hypothetical protein FRC08_002879 [Ceratobasidium sp. 394]|nr:hypothetical protein FRC08_002879 [Ceratobasidium sp. 394]